MTVRVRFAPSPTGSLHIGGARTALFNWLFARKEKGEFILRIEDTDTQRYVAEATEGIIRTMRWLGLDWDEGPEMGGPKGPYRQSERLELYRREARRLLDAGLAYPCYCTQEELAQMREEARKSGRAPRYDGRCRHLDEAARRAKEAAGIQPVLRIKAPAEGVTVVRDLIRGEVAFENHTIDDLIIMKSNGIPTYNFACVVDDHAMGITHVLRAEEHLSNTPKQIIIYRALGYPLPQFAHLPMILAPDRSKLSKRHGATAVEEFREQGYLAPAIINYLALLGWSPGEDREIMTLDEMVDRFSLEAINKAAAVYDLNKLTWLNARYINSLPLETVVREALPFLQAAALIPPDPSPEEMEYITRVVDAVRSRVHTLAELAGAVSYFFRDDFIYEEKGVRKYFSQPEVTGWLKRGREALSRVEPFDLEHTEAAYRQVMAELNIPGGKLIHPTRLALSGRTVGPGLFDIIVLLGREKCLERLDRAIKWIKVHQNV
ncbi:glutamate--tRNA ligase [Desulfofundulus thermobenzoicus]|uniref:Glutamate--tRNA ligase n=1 Tax=Desulfofundulus thermobenzoicus TaxID=29376 RepID=A0A6N7IRR7_9FIRM|nr:glutamate--tRNA ligase [Desulfofundulus thermobenzoicus]MQL52825.1 glutamate--tRNA ligase [Desulfofundulus thermobenzoicus]